MQLNESWTRDFLCQPADLFVCGLTTFTVVESLSYELHGNGKCLIEVTDNIIPIPAYKNVYAPGWAISVTRLVSGTSTHRLISDIIITVTS